jgi:hypothetical protein
MQAGRSRASPDAIDFLSVYPILSGALGPGVYLPCNRNEHQNRKKGVGAER